MWTEYVLVKGRGHFVVLGIGPVGAQRQRAMVKLLDEPRLAVQPRFLPQPRAQKGPDAGTY
jgi:hypothetical protein